MRRSLMQWSVVGACAAALIACDDSENGDDGEVNAQADEAVATYAEIALASYEDALEEARALDAALRDLVDEPSEAALTAARQAWLAAREPYVQTEVYRFYDGPIDDPESGPEGMINAWPMDESYVDYVEGKPDAGLINGSEDITAERLTSANEAGGEKNIATGYHPIEFLLWGQDRRDDGPGDRPFTDYVSGSEGSANNQERRGRYLTTASTLLLEHLGEVRDAWAEDEDNYRADFEADDPFDSLEKILTGMIVLSGFETAGERLQAALDSGDQEDEHSCFSDNTHRDMLGNVRGVQNVFEGRYERTDGSRVSGTGVHDVVAALDPELADTLRARIEASVAAAEALEPPFDREIAGDNPEGNARVQTLIDALYAQEETLFEVFDAFGLTVEIPE